MIDFRGNLYRFVLISDLSGVRFRPYRDLRANRHTARKLRAIVRAYKRLKLDQETGYRLVLLRRKAIPKRAAKRFRDAWH